MMPYIIQEQREELDSWVDILEPTALSLGELNYLITRLLLKTYPQKYQDFNALIGVLECVKLELYRRLITPYEQEKCDTNGDVYG